MDNDLTEKERDVLAELQRGKFLRVSHNVIYFYAKEGIVKEKITRKEHYAYFEDGWLWGANSKSLYYRPNNKENTLVKDIRARMLVDLAIFPYSVETLPIGRVMP